MLLKDVYDHRFVTYVSESISKCDTAFDSQLFLTTTQSDTWNDLALKQRMRFIVTMMGQCMSSDDYVTNLNILKKAVPHIPKHKHAGLALIIFADFVEVFGCKNYDISPSKSASFTASMNALAFFTEYGSSEFAVRQFIKIDHNKALAFFRKWAKSDNYHIRRLASEGLRPRLPWGEALPVFKKDPSDILPILEQLKNDVSEYVRRSVANNINDISKDNPAVVLDVMQSWQGNTCPRLIKHGLRTLLKLGDKKALEIVGIKTDLDVMKKISIKNFYLKKDKTKLGDSMAFDFALQNTSSTQDIRLEYIIHFLKKNGGHSKKVFQITSKSFSQGLFHFTRKHAFKDMTTRKHYRGKHFICLVVNGFELEKKAFELI